MDVKNGATYAGACYIGVSANLNPERNIIRALDLLQKTYPFTGVSRFYRTRAIDRPEQPDYLNGVVGIEHDGALRPLKFNVLRKIETALGRERSKDSWAARPIDLDILLCGDLIVRETGLIVPDPDIRERPFIMAALLDLDPDITLPDNRGPLNAIAKSPAIKQVEVARAFTQKVKERFAP